MSWHAWYSAGHDKKFGHVVYRDKNGLEIKCTEVSSEDVQYSKWNDAIYVGEVEIFLYRSQEINWDQPVLKLLNDIQDDLVEQKRCEKQFPMTGKCFCFTCPIKRHAN